MMAQKRKQFDGLFAQLQDVSLKFNVISIEYSDNLSNPILAFFGKKRMFFFHPT